MKPAALYTTDNHELHPFLTRKLYEPLVSECYPKQDDNQYLAKSYL